jgi:hypothetical protein
MTTFVLAWVLVTFDSYNSGMQYSPPLQTLEDCKRLQEFRKQLKISGMNEQCIQLNVMRGAQR